MVTVAEPYLVTRGFERTENVAKESAATKTSSGPRIDPAELRFKSGKEITRRSSNPYSQCEYQPFSKFLLQ